MANKKVSQLVAKPSVLVTDLFPIADPTTGQLFKTTISDLGTAIGSGVSSVNTLVGAVVLDTDDIQELASPTNRWFTDTRARAALSASSPLAYNSGTGAFSIAQANGSTNGFLSSADWTTFNAKQAALSGTGFVKISGTTISYDNSTYLTTSAAASTYLALAGGTLTGALNGTSATFTGDLTLSATNPRLYFTDTDNNPDYFISNTDGTFTVYDVTNSTSRLTLTNLYTTLNNTVKIQGDILLNQDSSIGPVAGYTTIASDASGIFLRLGTASSHAYLVLSGLTNYRNFTLPDATGTFALTSDLSAYLPLAGGTLTGTLYGTSASFSSSAEYGIEVYRNNSANSKINITNTTTTSGIDKGLMLGELGNNGYVYNYQNGSLILGTNGTDRLTISNTGAVTLTSALSGTSASFSGAVAIGAGTQAINSDAELTLREGNAFVGLDLHSARTSGNLGGIRIYNTSSTTDAIAQLLVEADGKFAFYNDKNATPRFTLASTGAATFSSSVTVVGNGRNVTINGGVDIKGDAGGWATQHGFSGSSGADLGGFGANGSGNSLTSYYIGTQGTPRIFINSAGNVGIGTTSPSQNLHVASSGVSRILIENTANASTGAGIQMLVTNGGTTVGNGTIRTDNGDTMQFFNMGGERMRITSGGEVLVGTTGLSVGARFQLKGAASSSAMSIEVGTNGYPAISFQNSSGAQQGYIVANSSSVQYLSISDYRLKEDLKQINGLDIINKIKVYDYKWKANDSRMDGVLAHELAEVLPYAVHGIKDGEEMQGVDYSKIVPVMVQAIKDLKKELDTLKNK